MKLKILILIVTPAALLQVVMFNPMLVLPLLLLVVILYISLPYKINGRQHSVSVKFSIILFLSFYFYSRYQFGLNWKRGEQLHKYLMAYHHQNGKFPSNLSVLSEEIASNVPMVKRGLINVPFNYTTEHKDAFEFSMKYTFLSEICYWHTNSGWDCNT